MSETVNDQLGEADLERLDRRVLPLMEYLQRVAPYEM